MTIATLHPTMSCVFHSHWNIVFRTFYSTEEEIVWVWGYLGLSRPLLRRLCNILSADAMAGSGGRSCGDWGAPVGHLIRCAGHPHPGVSRPLDPPHHLTLPLACRKLLHRPLHRWREFGVTGPICPAVPLQTQTQCIKVSGAQDSSKLYSWQKRSNCRNDYEFFWPYTRKSFTS